MIDIVSSLRAAVLIALYLSLAKGTKPISAKYPLGPIAFLEVKVFTNSSIPGTTPICAFLT